MSAWGTTRRWDEGRMLWYVRHYTVLVLIPIIGLALALPILTTAGAPLYEARALVVAAQLEASPQALPRYGQSVFYAGALPHRVAADPTVSGTPSELVPDRLDVVAAEDSIVLAVLGRDENPFEAARLANIGAVTFVDELNRAGAGTGVFALQRAAPVPVEPLGRLGLLPALALGAALGAILGIGVAGLIIVVRRPVTDAKDVESLLGAPLLGIVVLPRVPAGQITGPYGVPGLPSITRWLAAAPGGRVHVTSRPDVAAARQRVLVMLAAMVSSLRATRVEADSQVQAAVERHTTDLLVTEGSGEHRERSGQELVLVDGPEPVELLKEPTRPASIVLVVPRGTPRAHLRSQAAPYLSGELLGVVLVEVRSNRRGPGHGARSVPPRAADDQLQRA